MTEWLGQIIVMVIIVASAFIMGLSVGNEKGGKR